MYRSPKVRLQGQTELLEVSHTYIHIHTYIHLDIDQPRVWMCGSTLGQSSGLITSNTDLIFALQRSMVTLCTTRFNIKKILRSAHTVYLCVLCGSQNKECLRPYTRNPCFTPNLITPFSFKVPCKNIPFHNLCHLIFGLTSFSWVPSITLATAYYIISYGKANFDLRLFNLRLILP